MSSIKTDLAGIEEEAKLIYSEKIADYYDGTRKEEPTFDEVIEEMTNRGYEFITKSETGDGVIGIELDKDKITISINDSEKIRVILKKENIEYYIKAKSGYYEIKGESGGIELADTPSDVEDLESGTGSTNNIEVSIDGTIVKSYELNGNVITIDSGDKAGSTKVTVTYGEFSAECIVNVVIRPTSDSVANSNNTFSTSYGTIDVIWLDTNNNVIDKPNSPAESLTSNGDSLIPVVFNSTTNEWDTVDANSSNWYSYEDTSASNEKMDTSKWANVKTKNDSYFVWIPRYAYRITYYTGYTEEADGSYVPTGEPTGYYDGLGMWRAKDGALRYKLDENYKDVVDYNGEKYIVHPAFETNIDCGGWDKDLPGFWFAKFEMGGTENNLDSTYGTASLRSQTIGKQYETARKATYGYTGKEEIEPGDNSIKYTNFMSSHMVKNSEWGAVAYLAHSKYGRSGKEVTINETAYYRGGGAGTLAYIENVSQSSTGNVYGIYDMSGGTSERVAAFNIVDSSGYLSSNNWTQYTGLTVDSNSTKYATKYKNASGSRFGTNVQYLYGIVGDATKEVLVLNIVSGGWFGDKTLFTNNDSPFFNRGEFYTVGSSAGLFGSNDDKGETNGIYTFRTVLCP